MTGFRDKVAGEGVFHPSPDPTPESIFTKKKSSKLTAMRSPP